MTMQVSFALISVDTWSLNTQILLYFVNNIFYMMTRQLKKFGVQIVTIDIYAHRHKMECAKDNYNSLVMGGMLS